MIDIKTVGTIISVTMSVIESVAPKLQQSMKDFAERMINLSEKYPNLAEFAQMIDKAADIMGDVLYALGINADPADELGAKVEQADKGLNEFDSIESYINYLKDEIELDKEKFNSLSEEERVAYSITGMAVEAGAINEKIGSIIPADVVELVAKVAGIGRIDVKANDIVSVTSILKDEGVANLGDVCDCLMGEGDSDRLKTGEALIKAFNVIHPNEGNNILNEVIDEVRK